MLPVRVRVCSRYIYICCCCWLLVVIAATTQVAATAQTTSMRHESLVQSEKLVAHEDGVCHLGVGRFGWSAYMYIQLRPLHPSLEIS